MSIVKLLLLSGLTLLHIQYAGKCEKKEAPTCVNKKFKVSYDVKRQT